VILQSKLLVYWGVAHKKNMLDSRDKGVVKPTLMPGAFQIWPTNTGVQKSFKRKYRRVWPDRWKRKYPTVLGDFNMYGCVKKNMAVNKWAVFKKPAGWWLHGVRVSTIFGIITIHQRNSSKPASVKLRVSSACLIVTNWLIDICSYPCGYWGDWTHEII